MKKLLQELQELNVKIKLENDDIKIISLEGKIPKAVIEKLKSEKKNLIQYLKNINKNTAKILTPSDFTYKKLSIEELDKLKAKFDVEDIYQLTPMQEGMLFHAIHDPNSRAYFEQMLYRLNGKFSVELMQKSLNELSNRHQILRTAFLYNEFEFPLQIVLKNRSSDFIFEDIRDLKDENKEDYIVKYKSKDMNRGFNLQKDALMRISLLQLEDNEYEIIWSFHHILMDGWCFDIINKEFFEIYDSLVNNSAINLPAVTPYSVYIKWLSNIDKDKSLNYWKEYLDGYEKRATLPRLKSIDGEVVHNRESIHLSEEVSSKIRRITANNNVTTNVFIQCAWSIVLGRYSLQEDIVFGSIVSGRPSEIQGIETMVGSFMNNIPVRIKYSGNEKFSSLLKRVQKSNLDSEYHHHISLAEIQTKSVLKQDLVDHILAFENYPIDENGEGVRLDTEKGSELEIFCTGAFERTNYDLSIAASLGKGLGILLDYKANVYDYQMMKRLTTHFENILIEVVDNPDVIISEIDMITKEEKHQLLFDFNDTEKEYPKGKTIHQLFEEQVKNNPKNVALVCDNKQMTYQELNTKSNQLANALKEKGVKKDTIVGLMVDRSFEMIIGILGILKSGGAYLPIDKDYPEDRVVFMLNDCGANILLTSKDIINDAIYINLIKDKCNGINIIKTDNRIPIQDLDNHPIPDRSLANYEFYSQRIGMAMVRNSIALQGTRGCPYKCIYCSKIWPKNHVARSAEHIYQELEMYYNIGFRNFLIIDDIFNLDRENSGRFFQLIIDNGLKVKLFFPDGVRGDILTKDYIDLMVKAGTVNMAVALETASPRLQKLIKKKLNIEKLKENIEYICEKYPHVILELFTMHGLPTETEEDAYLTLNFIKSIRWLHLPHINILRIFPNTEMEKVALENGITKKQISSSLLSSFHKLPDTLPFSKAFSKWYQTELFSEYINSKERWLYVLPQQLKSISRDEIAAKYNSFLPIDIFCFQDLLDFIGIKEEELNITEEVQDYSIPDLNNKIKGLFPQITPSKDAIKILLVDLTQEYSTGTEDLYYVHEAPLGLMYLATYLKDKLKENVNVKIIKSGNDFFNDQEMKNYFDEFKPDVIGVRSLTIFKEFCHKKLSLIKSWHPNIPVVIGGPYATSDYKTVLNDKNVDIVVLGEGEITFYEIIDAFIKNNKKMPEEEILKQIKGIAFAFKAKKDLRELILMDEFQYDLYDSSENNINKSLSSDLAYVIYTSGSTGIPKGVLIEHKNVINYIYSMYDFYNQDFNSNDNCLSVTNSTFDVSVAEFFTALCFGCTLNILKYHEMLDIETFANRIIHDNITFAYIPPVLLNEISKNLSLHSNQVKLNKLYVGVEPIKDHTLEEYYKLNNNIQILNGYGPTETTISSTAYKYQTHKPKGENIPIGKPYLNTFVYIVNNFKLVPVGVSGELLIGGDGLSRGYQNRDDISKEKFIWWEPETGKCFEEENKPETAIRVYRTGDLCRWLSDGNIEFLGRMDSQVKIRGVRVELGEIESVMLKHDNIKECVTLAREENGDKYLCAYIVCEEEFNQEEIRKYLSEQLPENMMPSYFVAMDSFPLTTGAKVDRKALPSPEVKAGEDYVAPSNDIEEKMVRIWSEVLNIPEEEISINANFFDLGGHSLKATILVSKIRKEFDVNISLKEVFEVLTILNLARIIFNLNEKDSVLEDIVL